MKDFEEQLENLWNQGGKDVAATFLRRAVSLDMTLQDLLVTLNFAAVADHLGEIRLAEVVAKPQAARPSVPHVRQPAVVSAPAATAKKGKRRRRRTADELRAIHQAIVDMLRSEPGSLNTTQMVNTLADQGTEFDTVRVNMLMRQLEKEGFVTDLGGKPKSWRATSQLRERQNSSGLGEAAAADDEAGEED